ncbi:hypothetical protein PULV_a2860 [Pseudoalteromonas ulvae UL12]|uniref:DUF4124 domain-containing protein n=1 Tax=Pseudoalteromonas ulvae TaxID=107327 RepID=A0A244CNN7_PSEDV|nr:hypothetical protein [Pseudoalteromonas ulvae]MBE0364507.1 hypothetical protein [Pseudoalteromonas ulvae UL12]OUL57212.1 hypothetical protein B1199_13650 [Pseudoalteromonas ulvae]
MFKTTLIALSTFAVASMSPVSEASTATYIFCEKGGKVAWSEEHYNPRSAQASYYRCVNEGGTPRIVNI